MRFANRQQDAAGQTPFARAAVERLGDDRHRAIEVGVWHDDDEVLRTAEGLYVLTAVGAALIDQVRHRRRAQPAVDIGVFAITAPRAGLKTSSISRPDDGLQRPPMKF
jgi:hypothetical protein